MKLFKRPIYAEDLKRHHIGGHVYSTDQAYAQVARNLEHLITRKTDAGTFAYDIIKTMAINLTLHLEDTVTDAGLWRSFCTVYHQLYSEWLPFGWGKKKQPLDEVTKESCKFIIWMTLAGNDDYRHVNPLMPGIDALAEEVFEFLNHIFEDVPINDEMLEDLYAEHTLSDFFNVRKVLSWITEDSYLSDWDVTREGLDACKRRYKTVFENINSHQLDYAARALHAVSEKVGPLALMPQRWYATMLRTYGERNLKTWAEKVAAIESKRFDAYYIEGMDKTTIKLRGVDNLPFSVSLDSISTDPSKFEEYHNILIGAFAKYNDEWLVNGMMTVTSTEKTVEEAVREHQESVEGHQRALEIFEAFVAKNHGQRLYYFADMKAVKDWMTNAIGLRGVEDMIKGMPGYLRNGKQIIVFLPSDGDPEFCLHYTENINDPNNPYYKREVSREDCMLVIDDTGTFHGECIQYMIKHGMLSEALYYDTDVERGHRTYQDNIDFIARFMRRGGY